MINKRIIDLIDRYNKEANIEGVLAEYLTDDYYTGICTYLGNEIGGEYTYKYIVNYKLFYDLVELLVYQNKDVNIFLDMLKEALLDKGVVPIIEALDLSLDEILDYAKLRFKKAKLK